MVVVHIPASSVVLSSSHFGGQFISSQFKSFWGKFSSSEFKTLWKSPVVLSSSTSVGMNDFFARVWLLG